jgi:hypothetical protein
MKTFFECRKHITYDVKSVADQGDRGTAKQKAIHFHSVTKALVDRRSPWP